LTISLSLSDGRLSYKENDTAIGFASLESEGAMDICTIVNLENSVIPIGTYLLAELQCQIGTDSFPRLFKLTPQERSLTAEVYDSLYTDIYVYPSFSETNLSFKGIGVDAAIRGLLRVGDTLEVSYNASYESLTACSVVPQPEIGVTEAIVEPSNEITADFKGWGGFDEMDDKMVYLVCVELISGYCTPICKAAGVNGGISCNSGNEKGIGYYGTEGLHTIRFMAKYKGTAFSLYSEFKKEVMFNKIGDGEDPVALLQKVENATDINALKELNSKAILPITKLVESSAKRRALTTDSECNCNNKGTCRISSGIAICKCEDGYYGRACEIPSELYYTLKNYSEKVVYSIESMIESGVQLTLDSVMESFAILSAIPSAALPNDVRNSMLSSISNVLVADCDTFDMEHIYEVISNLMRLISADINYDAAEKSVSNYKHYLSQITKIESIIRQLLNKKVVYQYFLGQQEVVAIGPLYVNYLSNLAKLVMSPNISYSYGQDSAHSFAIEYPYEIANVLKIPSGCSIGSNALGIYVYSSANSNEKLSVDISFGTYVMN
jgi:hypothetical protein